MADNDGGAGDKGGGGNGGGGAPTPPAPPAAPAPAAGTFTQEQVNEFTAAEKEQGRRAALKDVQDKLGVPLEEAEKMLKDFKKAQDDAMTEVEKREKTAAEREAAAEARAQASVDRERKATAQLALITAGVRQDRLEHAVDSLAPKLEPEEDGTFSEDKAKKAAEKFKSTVPELFGEVKSGPRGGPRDSDPKGTPPADKPSEEAMSKGKEYAERYNKGELGASVT